MTVRALVVGVPGPGIPDAGAEARAFADWLRATKGADVDLCVTAEDTTAGALVRRIARLTRPDLGATDEFYFYFSGHGASFVGRTRIEPLLLTSDFTTPEESGRCVILLDELREVLARALGPGEHYYFVDVCRSLVTAESFNPAGLGLAVRPCERGLAECRHTLYSVALDRLAPGDGRFSARLLAALRGEGTREQIGEQVGIRFSQLMRVLPDADGDTNPSCDGVIVTGLDKPRLTVRLRGAAPAGRTVVTLRGASGTQSATLVDAVATLAAFPGPYALEIEALNDDGGVLSLARDFITLTADRTLELELGGPAGARLHTPAVLRVHAPTLRGTHLESASVRESPERVLRRVFERIRQAAPGLLGASTNEPGIGLAALGMVDASVSSTGIRLVCAGESPRPPPRVRLDGAGTWRALAAHPECPGIFVTDLDAAAGPHALEVTEGGPVVGMATHVVVGRRTLVTIHPRTSATGRAIHQYILSDGSEQAHLVSSYQVQRDFLRGRALVLDGAFDPRLTAGLGPSAWDPLRAWIAVFEAVRRELSLDVPVVGEVVDRLLADHGDWADAAVVRRLRGAVDVVQGLPVFAEARLYTSSPPPAGRWVFDQIWTTWQDNRGVEQ